MKKKVIVVNDVTQVVYYTATAKTEAVWKKVLVAAEAVRKLRGRNARIIEVDADESAADGVK